MYQGNKILFGNSKIKNSCQLVLHKGIIYNAEIFQVFSIFSIVT